MDPRNLGASGSPFGFNFPLPGASFPFPSQFGGHNWTTGTRGVGDLMASSLAGGAAAADAFSQAAAAAAYSQMNHPFWEQMYRLHASASAGQLRGMQQPTIDSRVPLSPDFLRHSNGGMTADVFSMHAACATPSVGLPFTAEASRMPTPQPTLSRAGRKRALSISPFGSDFDMNTVIRMSPTALMNGGNGSRCSSSASGTYGQFLAGAMSPTMSMDAARLHQFQQFQQFMMRQNSQNMFSSPTNIHHCHHGSYRKKEKHSTDSDSNESKRNHSDHPPEPHRKSSSHHPDPVVSSSVSDMRPRERVRREMAQTSTGDVDEQNDAGDKGEDDFIETHCRWIGCERDFATQRELVEHVNKVHLEDEDKKKKDFICRWRDCCREEKPFKANYMLVVHMRRHTGEKPYNCKIPGCYKAYSRYENLKTHARSHTGEKPYMCEFPGCSKAFSNASDRAKHQNRTHSNAKPYVCKAVPNCTKRYTDPSSLRKHIKTVHGPEFFSQKRQKNNDVPRRRHDGPGGDHPSEDSHSSSNKSGTGSAPSTPRGPIKLENMDMSPGYSLPSSVFTNCSSVDSPSSGAAAPAADYHLPINNHRSNDPIAEEDDFLDFDIPHAERVRGHGGGGSYGQHDVLVGLPAPPDYLHARRGAMSAKMMHPELHHQSSAHQQGTVFSDLSRRFSEVNVMDYCPPLQQDTTMSTAQRRGSNLSDSTYYSGMVSDGSTLSAHPSRRVSEVSMSYDQVESSSSRRSSEPSLAPTLSGYQQKIQMRQQQQYQQHNQPPAVQPYHGSRRASLPVGLLANGGMQPRTQPLTRQNLQRHNSLFEGGHLPESNGPQMRNDILEHLQRVAEEAQKAREANPDHEDFSDDDDEDLPIVHQNYPSASYEQPLQPPFYPSAPRNHRSASFTQQTITASLTSQRNMSVPNYTNTMLLPPGLNQRRGSCGVARPLTEGSPDSYEVSSSTLSANVPNNQQQFGSQFYANPNMTANEENVFYNMVS